MSEFSESVYIRSSNRETGVQWVNQCRMSGYVLKPRGNWVQVFPDWGDFSDFDKKHRAMARSEGILIYYCYAADHLWSTVVYQEGKPLFKYECAFEVDEFDLEGISVDELATLLDADAAELRPLFYTGGGEASWEELADNAALFADAVGLPNYAFASYSYADMDADLTGLDKLFVDRDADEPASSYDDDFDDDDELDSPEPTRKGDGGAPWQAAYELASHFLKRLHDEELLELTFDTRLARDRLIERLTKTVIYNPVSSDTQVVQHWLDSLISSPEIVDVYASDDELLEILRLAMEDVQSSRAN